MFEDELIPLFEKCGTIWDLRLMMDPMTGTNRGYAFVTFTSRDAAQNAVKEVLVIHQICNAQFNFFFFEKKEEKNQKYLSKTKIISLFVLVLN